MYRVRIQIFPCEGAVLWYGTWFRLLRSWAGLAFLEWGCIRFFFIERGGCDSRRELGGLRNGMIRDDERREKKLGVEQFFVENQNMDGSIPGGRKWESEEDDGGM